MDTQREDHVAGITGREIILEPRTPNENLGDRSGGRAFEIVGQHHRGNRGSSGMDIHAGGPEVGVLDPLLFGFLAGVVRPAAVPITHTVRGADR